jgi:uncharacterized protein YlxW (UPF0749 family)
MAAKKPIKPIKPIKPGKQGQISEDFLTLLLDEVQAARAEIAELKTQGAHIMATFQEQLDKLQTSVDAAEQRADDRDAALTQKLADLQAAFDALKASGAAPTEAQLAQMQASIDDLDAFATTPPIVGETPVT